MDWQNILKFGEIFQVEQINAIYDTSSVSVTVPAESSVSPNWVSLRL